MTATPMAPVSWGELIDKITILEIKAERLTDAAKRDSVVTELQSTLALQRKAYFQHPVPTYVAEFLLGRYCSSVDDEEIADYVAGLEARGDAEVDVNEAMSKVDGDTLAAEFERYLRRRGR